MQLNFLINVEFFSQFDENSVEGIKVVAVAASGCGEVQDDQIIISVVFEGLVVVIPLGKQGLLSYSAVGLDDKRLVILSIGFKIEPFFNHEVIFFESISGLLFVKIEDSVWGAEWG